VEIVWIPQAVTKASCEEIKSSLLRCGIGIVDFGIDGQAKWVVNHNLSKSNLEDYDNVLTFA
jgi:hypothetical protein